MEVAAIPIWLVANFSMNTPGNFSMQEWHGHQIFCWYGEEASKYKGKTETFVEIEKGRINVSEVLLNGGKPVICAVVSSAYQDEEIESSHMSEAFVMKKGKMVGSADSMQGTLAHLIEVMSQELKKNIQRVYLLPPSGTFFYKIITLPQMPDKDLESAIENEKAAFIEAKLKDEPAVIKHWRLGTLQQKDSTLEHILLVGVPNTSILNYIEILSDSKLNISGFNTPQLLYFYYLDSIQPKKTLIFIEITDYSLRVYFFKSGILTFIRYINIPKWKDASMFTRNASKQIHHSALYLNQQHPDANVEKYIFFNRTSLPGAVNDIATELELTPENCENYDVSQFAELPGDLAEKLSENHISLTSPIYSSSLVQKNEKVVLPLLEFDVRIQNSIRRKASIMFLILWILVLGGGYLFLQNIVTKQTEQNRSIVDSEEQTTITKSLQDANSKNQDNVSQHEHLQKLIKLQYQWGCIIYSLLESRKNNPEILFTKMAMRQPDKGIVAEETVIPDLEMELQIKIMQANYITAAETYKNFKNELANYFNITERDRSSDKISSSFNVKLSLKEGATNEK